MTGPILLAFGIWMLFTSDFSWTNAVIGLAASVLVSLLNRHHFSARQLIGLIGTALIRLPQAIWESFMIVLLPHRHERISTYRMVDPKNPWAVFCQTFIVTFTPRSLVISEEKDGEVRTHSLERKERS
jgi:multicomponent Na+:H+ antiporter subunit E